MGHAHRGGAPLLAIALMLASMALIASNDAVGKYLSQTYSIWQVLWIRSWVWLAFALAWIAGRGGLRRAMHSETPWLQTARSLLLVVEVSVLILAFKHLPLGDVTAVASATPLVVLVLAVLFLGERVGPHRWTAVVAGMIGMLLVARPGATVFGWLTLLPMLGALLWGIYQMLLRLVSRRDSEETTLLWTGGTLFVVCGLIAPWWWQTPADAATWGLFVLLGVLNTGGHFALIAALHRAEASALQPFTYSVVAWAMLLGWLVYGDRPDAWTVGGTALIVAGGLYALHRERRLAAGAG